MDPLLSPHNPWAHLLWILAAAAVGFAAPALLAWRWRWSRRRLVAPNALVALAMLIGYARFSELDFQALLNHNWFWGVALGLGLGMLLVGAVRRQPASARGRGRTLAFDLLWLGGVYGLVDALFLSVLPILAAERAFALWGIADGALDTAFTGLVALAASLLVTAAYHLGYREFQGPALRGPIVGNALISLAYLLAGNPLAALISHVAMHLAAVLQGPETTIQLPPHYAPAESAREQKGAPLAAGG